MPSLAMLSGQKSAPESIQATDYICTSLSHLRSHQTALLEYKGSSTLGAIAFGYLPKVLGVFTADRTAYVAAGTIAVWRDATYQ